MQNHWRYDKGVGDTMIVDSLEEAFRCELGQDDYGNAFEKWNNCRSE